MLEFYQVYFFTPEGVRCFVYKEIDTQKISKELSFRLNTDVTFSREEKADFPLTSNNLVFKDIKGNEHKVRIEKQKHYDSWLSPVVNIHEIKDIIFKDDWMIVKAITSNSFSSNEYVKMKSELAETKITIDYDAIRKKQEKYPHISLDLSTVFNLLGEGELNTTQNFYNQLSGCLGYEMIIQYSEEFEKHITSSNDSAFGSEFLG